MVYFGQVFDFRTIAYEWSQIGMFDIVLPMLLIFTVVYSILQRTKIFTGKKEIDAVVALMISFFVIGNPEVAGFFMPLFSNAILGIAILVVFLLIMGLVVGKPGRGWGTITLVGGAVIFFWVMSRAAEYFAGYNIIFSTQWWYVNSYWIIPLIFIGITLAIIFMAPETPEERRQKTAMDIWPFSKWYEEREQ